MRLSRFRPPCTADAGLGPAKALAWQHRRISKCTHPAAHTEAAPPAARTAAQDGECLSVGIVCRGCSVLWRKLLLGSQTLVCSMRVCQVWLAAFPACTTVLRVAWDCATDLQRSRSLFAKPECSLSLPPLVAA